MELRNVDLNLLILFEAVYSTGNVGRAAKQLGLTQPAASNGLARLRKLLDDPLFSRATGGVAPTTRAQQLIGPVRDALKIIREGLKGDGEIDLATYQRHFRVVLLDPLEPILMPSIVRLITDRAPGISIEAVAGDSRENHITDMRAGTIDMAVYTYPFDAADIVTAPLGPTEVVAIARRGHRGIGNRLTAEKLQRLPHLALARPLRALTNMPRDMAAHNVNRRIPYAVSKMWAVPWMVAHTDLIGFVPRRFAEAVADSNDLAIHEMPVPIAEQYSYLMWHERNTADPGHKWLRERLLEAASAWSAQPRGAAAGNLKPTSRR